MSNDYVHRHSHFVADKEDDLSSSSNDYVPDPMDLDIDDNNQAPVDTSNSEKAQADLRKAWDSQDLANRGSQTAAVHRRFSDLNPRKLNRMNRAVNRLKSRYNGSPNRFNNNKKLTFRCRTECEPVAWTVGLRTPNATRIPLALLSTRFLIPRTWASVHKLTNVGFFAPCDPPVGEPNTDQSYFKPHVPAACAHCGDDELLGTGICFSCARRRGVELLGPGAGFLLKGLVATFFWKDPESEKFPATAATCIITEFGPDRDKQVHSYFTFHKPRMEGEFKCVCGWCKHCEAFARRGEEMRKIKDRVRKLPSRERGVVGGGL